MKPVYGRDLDLNLLRVFVIVAEAGTVTEAASRLYLTQPAVSAALRRLARTVGTPLFARAGRRLELTARGERLLASARPHLGALIEAALAADTFDPKTSERTVRVGLADAHDSWLLPPLLNLLDREAPRMKLIVLPVQFRTVAELLVSGRIDMAVTVADGVPAGTRRLPLFSGGFVCLSDPRKLRLPGRLTLQQYLAEEHVVVSYNGDLRGVVEDTLGFERRVRISVPSFQSVSALIEGTRLVATVPRLVAQHMLSLRPALRISELPKEFEGASGATELLWRSALDDDGAQRFVRDHVVRLAQILMQNLEKPRARRREE